MPQCNYKAPTRSSVKKSTTSSHLWRRKPPAEGQAPEQYHIKKRSSVKCWIYPVQPSKGQINPFHCMSLIKENIKLSQSGTICPAPHNQNWCRMLTTKKKKPTLTNHSVFNRNSQETLSFSSPKNIFSNGFLPLPPLLLPSFSLEDAFILKESNKAEAAQKKAACWLVPLLFIEHRTNMNSQSLILSEERARLKHKDRNLSLEREWKVLCSPLSPPFSPKFLLYQVVPIIVTDTRLAGP